MHGILTEQERKERIEHWEKNIFFQMSKKIDLEIDGNYFDYISGSDKWKGTARYKEKHNGHEIVIEMHQAPYATYYGRQWCRLNLKGRRYNTEEANHKCLSPASGLKFIRIMVAHERTRLDNIDNRTAMRNREQELFTKLFGKRCTINNDVEGEYEKSPRNIRVNIDEHRMINLYSKESSTKLTFGISGIAGNLTSQQVREIIKTIESN